MKYLLHRYKHDDFPSDHNEDNAFRRISVGFDRTINLPIALPFRRTISQPSNPIQLLTIKSRIERRFYRRADAIEFDINQWKLNNPGQHSKIIADILIKVLQ